MRVHPRVGREPVADLDPFVGGVVVHAQVQLALGVGAGDLLAKGQELLVSVCQLTRRAVTLPVAISKAANRVVVPWRR